MADLTGRSTRRAHRVKKLSFEDARFPLEVRRTSERMASSDHRMRLPDCGVSRWLSVCQHSS